MTWKANILTLYPEIYPGYLSYSLLGKALEKKIWELNIYNSVSYTHLTLPTIYSV